MAVLGTYLFNPKLAECIEESFERGPLIKPVSIGPDHIDSALRSVKFMLQSEWAALGLKSWKILQGTANAVADATSFTPAQSGLQDILGMVLRRNNADTEVVRISREDYLLIVSKQHQGRVCNYYVDRTMVDGVHTIVVKVWPRMKNSTDVFVYDYLVQTSDVGTPVNTLDMPSYVFEAFVAGLAARLAQKFKPERWADLQTIYCGNPIGPGQKPIGGQLKLALEESRGRADVRLTIPRR